MVLALGTGPAVFVGVLRSAWNDNEAVMNALLRGGGAGPEVNLLVSRVWIVIASAGTDLWAGRVESKSNVADGPTRQDLAGFSNVGATWQQPVIPSWVADVWSLAVS